MLASWLRAFTDHLTGFLYKQPLLALLSICASIPFLVSLCFCIRSKFFHPLHSIPGPFLAGCSDFFNLYLFASKRVHKKVLALHSKYGPFVRVAPNVVSINDPKLLPIVYHRHADKTPFYSTGMAGEEPPLLQTEGDKAHAAKLKVLSPTYSMKHMRLLEDVVDERIIFTVNAIRERFAATGIAFDLAVWSRWHVYDTITQLIYGKPVGMVEKGEDVNGLIKHWHHVFTLGGLVGTLPWLIHPIITNNWLKRFLMPNKSHHSGAGHIMNVHEALFKERMQRPELARPGNIFDSFRATVKQDGQVMTPEEAEHQCFIVTVGSQDTSAAFISAFMYYVTRDDRVYEKLWEEIQSFQEKGLLSHPVVSFDETCQLKYFMACVREALRISPSVSMPLPRFAPPGGIMLGSTWIPEGVELAANPYVIHRDAEVYGEDADEFRPERWFEDPARVHLMNKYFLAFGYGSRKCLGRNIALFESQKFCLQLLRDFHLRIKDPKNPFKTENWGINVFWKQYMFLTPR